MQCSVVLSGGSHAGDIVKVEMHKFKIGKRISIRGGLYEIQPGPASDHFQETQEDHDDLCAVVKFIQ